MRKRFLQMLSASATIEVTGVCAVFFAFLLAPSIFETICFRLYEDMIVAVKIVI